MSVVLVFLTWTTSDLTGTYVYVNGGKCHFLAFDSDTLILHDSGKVQSRNFPEDAVFERKKSVFREEVKISSKKENQYSVLLVKGNFLSGRRLVVCLDQKGYYAKK